MKRLVYKFALKRWLYIGAAAFMLGMLVLGGILAPAGQQAIAEYVLQANWADELVADVQAQADRWRIPWPRWAAYWGMQEWKIPVKSRLERLEEAREYNRRIREDPCHPDHVPPPENPAICEGYEQPPDRSTNFSTIERAWHADAVAYMEAELTRIGGPPPSDPASFHEALKAKVPKWRTLLDLAKKYQDVWDLVHDPDQADGVRKLTKGVDQVLYLRLQDWEYTAPVAGPTGDIVDSWRRDSQYVDDEDPLGLLIPADQGTPVVAVTAGTIVEVGWNVYRGWIVVLQGDDGMRYRYAQLRDRSPVAVGQRVYRGEWLGETGNRPPDAPFDRRRRDQDDKPGLHFGIITNADKNLAANPYPYVTAWMQLGDPGDDHGGIPVEPPPGWVPTDGFTWPAEGPITSPFGYRLSPVCGCWRFHYGIDIGIDVGTPLRASQAGEVVHAAYDDIYGWLVKVNHDGGYQSWYAHQSRLLVRVGDRVEQGAVVGLSGATGAVTGPHLHFEIHYQGTPVNPLELLPD